MICKICGEKTFQEKFSPRTPFSKAFMTYDLFSPPVLSIFFRRISNVKRQPISAAFLCGKRDLNPYGVNHTPLKRARLPVPPLPRILRGTWRNSHAHSRGYCAGHGGTLTLTPADIARDVAELSRSLPRIEQCATTAVRNAPRSRECFFIILTSAVIVKWIFQKTSSFLRARKDRARKTLKLLKSRPAVESGGAGVESFFPYVDIGNIDSPAP